MIEEIKKKLNPYYKRLSTHPIYNTLKDSNSIIKFMQCHIYSVWDFMNLLKYLQNHLTCLNIPWKPYHSAKLSRLINEIVLEEESDIIDSKPTSHFIYYLEALNVLDKSCTHINQFLNDLNTDIDYKKLITKNYIPKPAKNFMKTTNEFCNSSLLEVAASFTFGRENLVPTLFNPIVKEITKSKNKRLTKFGNYLQRHIELDGEEHSKLSLEMLTILANNKADWKKIEVSAKKALTAREKFWDEINLLIKTK